jgi:hypothetical protein
MSAATACPASNSMSNRGAEPMSKKDVERTAIPHEIIRSGVPIQQRYDDFIRAFESAVPVWGRERATALVERKAPRSEVVADVAALGALQ